MATDIIARGMAGNITKIVKDSTFVYGATIDLTINNPQFVGETIVDDTHIVEPI